jgi:flagellar protein FliO/FliZ
MESGMQFMTALLGGSTNTLLNSAFALGIVLVGIVLGLWGLKNLSKMTSRLGQSRDRRLVVVDKAMVDGKRQVVIIRRDNVEHVIMTGGPQDLVIESGIAVAEPAPVVPPQRRTWRPAARPAAQPKPAEQPAAAPKRPADIERPVTPDRPVYREDVDRLRDLARPAPLKPRDGVSLRHTNLLRTVRDESQVIPMAPPHRVENSTGATADSAKTGPIEAVGGQRRFVGRSRFLRSITRGEGK